jgi:hypothetical protein
MTASPRRPPRGFSIRRLQELIPPRPRRDWDRRFVSATLLLYALIGAAFYFVGWLNRDAPPDAVQAVPPDARPVHEPFVKRLPHVPHGRAPADEPTEAR